MKRVEFEHLDQEDLDSLVHELKAAEAADINNQGREEQLKYLLTEEEEPHVMKVTLSGSIAQFHNEDGKVKAKLLLGGKSSMGQQVSAILDIVLPMGELRDTSHGQLFTVEITTKNDKT